MFPIKKYTLIIAKSQFFLHLPHLPASFSLLRLLFQARRLPPYGTPYPLPPDSTWERRSWIRPPSCPISGAGGIISGGYSCLHLIPLLPCFPTSFSALLGPPSLLTAILGSPHLDLICHFKCPIVEAHLSPRSHPELTPSLGFSNTDIHLMALVASASCDGFFLAIVILVARITHSSTSVWCQMDCLVLSKCWINNVVWVF